LTLESNNPAWARESRPGPTRTVLRGGPAGILQSGPAGIELWRPWKKSRPGRILPIWPSRGAVEMRPEGAPDAGALKEAQPGQAGAEKTHLGGRRKRSSRGTKSRPSRGSGQRPSRIARGGRGVGQGAQPGRRPGSPAGVPAWPREEGDRPAQPIYDASAQPG
jgi:hypothetical protein